MTFATSRCTDRLPTSLTKRLVGTGLLLGLLGTAIQAAAATQREGAPLDQLNLGKKGLALEGYDPVAYFPLGGGQARKGKQDLSLQFRGITYRFAAEKNRESFVQDPERFEPDYGGWCAYAMTKSEKVEVDPKSFLIEDGRLLVFYDGLFNDTRNSWLKQGSEALRPRADAGWDKFLKRTKEQTVKRRAEIPKLAFEGLDPTTRNEAGKGEPGSAAIRTRIGNLAYRFVSKESRIRFLLNPEEHLPKATLPGPKK